MDTTPTPPDPQDPDPQGSPDVPAEAPHAGAPADAEPRAEGDGPQEPPADAGAPPGARDDEPPGLYGPGAPTWPPEPPEPPGALGAPAGGGPAWPPAPGIPGSPGGPGPYGAAGSSGAPGPYGAPGPHGMPGPSGASGGYGGPGPYEGPGEYGAGAGIWPPAPAPRKAPRRVRPGPRAVDPPAAALGNAALVGVGYWMMRRRWLGSAAVAGTLVLLVLLLAVGRGWVEIVTVVWWAAMVAHGWRLAGGRVPGVETRRSRPAVREAARGDGVAARPGDAQADAPAARPGDGPPTGPGHATATALSDTAAPGPGDAAPALRSDGAGGLGGDAGPSLPGDAAPSLPRDGAGGLGGGVTPALPGDEAGGLGGDVTPPLPGDTAAAPGGAAPGMPADARRPRPRVGRPGRGGGRGVRSQRVLAAAFAVPVLLVAGVLRWDALHVAHSMVAARDAGDCAKVVRAAGGVWFGLRIGDGPALAHGDRVVRGCRALRGAAARLRDGLGGDTRALAGGFATMSRVLGEPGTGKVVGVTLDGFLRGLPAPDPCHTATVTDWLRDRRPTHDALDRSAAVVPRVAPAALLGCGDHLMDAESWQPARTRYQQLLDQYPKDQRAGRAKDGVHKATLKIELAHVKDLLDTIGDEQPKYCSSPAKYSGADAYGKGTNHALFYGNDHYTDKLPHGWKADGPEDAQVIVCAGDDKDGPTTQTCPYVSHSSISLDHTTYVTFHEIAIPVKVYELRTGKLVEHRTVHISGSSCPPHLSYTYYNGLDTGPDSDQYVRPSTGDVRSAFDSLINR